eukprot:Skav212876  [mRNA]  locus=scaffold1006:44078:50925:- [translate_table: standard]
MHVLQDRHVVVANRQFMFDLGQEDVAASHVADVMCQGSDREAETFKVAQVCLRGDEIKDPPEGKGRIHCMTKGVVGRLLAPFVAGGAFLEEGRTARLEFTGA